MKRILSTAIAVLLLVGAVQAQNGRKEHGKHEGKWPTELNLSTEQKAKLKSIREAQRAEMETRRKNGTPTPEQRQAIHEKYKAQYEAILTPAQKEEWEKQKQQHKADRKNGDQTGRRSPGLQNDARFGRQAAFLKKELNLSAEQQTKLQGLLADYEAKARALRADNSLAKEAQKQQLRSLNADYLRQGKAVLSAEQLQKLETMQAERKDRRHRSR